MSIYEFFHYSLFLGLFLVFTYNKKQPPAFGAAFTFWCIFLSFFGLLFSHISNNLSNYNVLTANAPFFYQISGTWSNHEGSILLWCWILSFYGFLLCYRSRSQSHNVSKRGGPRESLLFSFVLNFLKNSIRSLPRYEEKRGVRQLYTLFVLRTHVDSELCSQRKRTFDGPALFAAPLYPERKMSFAILDAKRSHGSQERKRTHPFLHLVRDDKERASSLNEERIDGTLGIALFFFLFLLASSDPFVRNLFVCTEPLAELNPVLQDPILAIHPPCIYAGDVASAISFGLCRSKMMNRIVALYSKTMRKHAAEKNGTRLCYAGCVGSRIRSKLFTLPFKSLSSKSLCWTAGANTVISDQDQEALRIWILICWSFLTVGILLGSWWAYHELGWGGWWFWDPVENASFMPWVLATACIHSVLFPLLHSWTFFLNIVIFLSCILGTFSIRSGVLASVHSFATDDTRGIFLGWFFLLMTGISILLFSQMKQQAAVRRNYQKQMVVGRRSLAHLRHCATAQPRSLMLWKN